MIARAIGILGITALFLGSMGIPMYEHYCAHEQVTIHTLFAESKHCETEAFSHKDTCCSPAEKEGIERKNCCSDELKNLSLAFDYFEQLKKDTVLSLAIVAERPVIYSVHSTIPDAHSWRFPDVSDPPPLTVNDRLPLVGCWRL